MPTPRTLVLTPPARGDLERIQARDPRPYLRERATAMLLLGNGWSVRQVARHGLYRVRRPETVSDWLDRYLVAGVAGLRQHPRAQKRLPP